MRGLRIGVGGVEHGLEAVGMAGFGEQRLGLGHVIGVAGVGLVVARHRRRQRLVGGHCAAVDDADDAVLVDRHVDRLAHLDVVEGLHVGVHRDVAGVQLVALDDARLLRRIVLDLEEFRRRNAVAGNIDLALLQAQQRHERLLADLEGDLVEIAARPCASNPCCARRRGAGRASIR